MMRYQRVSPDYLPLPNGKKPSTVGTSGGSENGRSNPNGVSSSSAGYEIKGFRYRSPSRNQDYHHHTNGAAGNVGSPLRSDNVQSNSHKRDTTSLSRDGSGDMLLQWGQKKRARVSRSEIRALADESSSSGQGRQPITTGKVPSSRRLDDNSKLQVPSMPPPAAPLTANGRGGSLRKETAALLSHRNLEKRSAGNGSPSRTPAGGSGGGGNGSRVVSRSTAGKRSSPPTPDKVDKKQQQQQQTTSRSVRDDKSNGSVAASLVHHHQTAADHHHHHVESTSWQSEVAANNNNNNTAAAAPVERVEWPRIFLSLSRKEKEDDFLAMKGTKLPQRPKKRAKNVDRGLQYCFPGMWLSDLTKSRYEVREKKSVKKQQQKRRGLKGMESMDNNSESE